MPENQRSKFPLYLTLGLVFLLVGGYLLIPGVREFLQNGWEVLSSEDETRTKIWVSSFGAWGPIVLIFGFVLQMFTIVLPSWLLIVVAILAYGPIWGSLIALSGIFLASSFAYWLARSVGAQSIKRLIGTETDRKLQRMLNRYGFWLIVIVRLAPFLSNDAISFVAGLVRFGYIRFIAGTMLGITPLVVFIAIIGQANDSLKTGLVWASVISLVLFGLYVWWDRKKNPARE